MLSKSRTRGRPAWRPRAFGLDALLVKDMTETDRVAAVDAVTQILARYRTIAVVGLASESGTSVSSGGAHMREQGYRVIPVNPYKLRMFDEPAYPDLGSVPEPVDRVSVFRRSEEAGMVVDTAIRIGAGQCECRKGCAMPRRCNERRMPDDWR